MSTDPPMSSDPHFGQRSFCAGFTIAQRQFSQVHRGSMRPSLQRQDVPQEQSGLAVRVVGPSSHGLAIAGDARNRIKNNRMMYLIAEGWTTRGSIERDSRRTAIERKSRRLATWLLCRSRVPS